MGSLVSLSSNFAMTHQPSLEYLGCKEIFLSIKSSFRDSLDFFILAKLHAYVHNLDIISNLCLGFFNFNTFFIRLEYGFKTSFELV